MGVGVGLSGFRGQVLIMGANLQRKLGGPIFNSPNGGLWFHDVPRLAGSISNQNESGNDFSINHPTDGFL